jgi:tRNA threonylcarbamoyladenosine biosynthesis protein TsaE
MRAGFVIRTHSEAETFALGQCAGEESPAGIVLCLNGELGTGKTVFVRGLTEGLLGPGQGHVASPTYVLQRVYRGGAQGVVYHLDLYRLCGGAAEFEAAGLHEPLADPQGVVCIEWAERVAQAMPDDRVEIEFEHVGLRERLIHVLATGAKSGVLVDALVARAGTRARLKAFIGKAEDTAHPAARGEGDRSN